MRITAPQGLARNGPGRWAAHSPDHCPGRWAALDGPALRPPLQVDLLKSATYLYHNSDKLIR